MRSPPARYWRTPLALLRKTLVSLLHCVFPPEPLQPILTLLVTTVVVAIGWLVVHRLNSIREQEAKKREIRLRYLIEAYRAFANFSGRTPPFESKIVSEFEQAVADIQLLGTSKQVASLLGALENHKALGEIDLREVMNLLRAELRESLGLSQVSEGIKWVRIEPEFLKRAG